MILVSMQSQQFWTLPGVGIYQRNRGTAPFQIFNSIYSLNRKLRP